MDAKRAFNFEIKRSLQRYELSENDDPPSSSSTRGLRKIVVETSQLSKVKKIYKITKVGCNIDYSTKPNIEPTNFEEKQTGKKNLNNKF